MSHERDSYDIKSMEYVRLGHGGLPVLFLHGWGGNCSTMSVLSKPLSAHRETISLSLPGFGNSPSPDFAWGTYDYVEKVNDWLTNLGIEQCDIVAHSFGGRVSLAWAALFPERINKMALIGSAGIVAPRSIKTRAKIAYAKAMVKTAKFLPKTFAEALLKQRERMGSADWRNSLPIMRAVMNKVISEDLSDILPNIKQPVLLIWGENDKDVPLSSAKKMHRLISGSELKVIPNAEHYPFLDDKGAVLEIMWKWFDLPRAW